MKKLYRTEQEAIRAAMIKTANTNKACRACATVNGWWIVEYIRD